MTRIPLHRRTFSIQVLGASAALLSHPLGTLSRVMAAEPTDSIQHFARSEEGRRWLKEWEAHILAPEKTRYCDTELGEELGWLVSPYVNGFYQGYLATQNTSWIDRLIEWTDACIVRATLDPDGFRGWPKGNGGGGESADFDADSLLGETMLTRPVILMAGRIQRTPELQTRYGAKAASYLKLAEELFAKWELRKAWRDVPEGGIWVVPEFGLAKKAKGWSAGHATRAKTGFSNPANKANHIARWHLALADVTGKSLYRTRAEGWFRLMKHRIHTRESGRFLVWNYWDPAGPWDYKADGSTQHWVGVHPNGGYYQIDVEAIADAYEHGLVFTKDDLRKLIETNRDFMWDQKLNGARFRRIDGGETDPRWKNSPGVLWTGLVPHDPTLRRIFVANHRPASWGGLASTPWFLALNT